MGASGDMLAGALLELCPDKEAMLEKLNAIGIPGVNFEAFDDKKCSIKGTHFRVTVNGSEEVSEDVDIHAHHHHDDDDAHHPHSHDDHPHDDHDHPHDDHDHDHHDHDHHDHDHAHHHHHTSMGEIREIVSKLNVQQHIKDKVMQVYELIAAAESKAHGTDVSQVHFHEVGSMDAIADITAVCVMMDELAPEKVYASPVHVGSGNVRCAHGIVSVPAPATAFLLEGIPAYGANIKGELCTPTGAALLKMFVNDFSGMPTMITNKTGRGTGSKDFEVANMLVASMGEAVGPAAQAGENLATVGSAAVASSGDNNAGEPVSPELAARLSDTPTDVVVMLSCNIDDMTGEKLGYVQELLFDMGALDVYTVPIGMKHSRPGVMLCVIAKLEDKDLLARVIFKNTTTIGIRETPIKRMVLNRSTQQRMTPFGPVRYKVSTGYGVYREKPEYADVVNIARKTGRSIAEIEEILKMEGI